MDWSWFDAGAVDIVMVVLSTVAVYSALVLFTRVAGLRSFSKMSSFDFAITVAFGTILASTALTEDPPVLQALAALAALFTIQYVISIGRRRSGAVSSAVDNTPLLLMVGAEVIQENLDLAQMTEADLRAKLREANVIHLGQVRAVVMEATGDVSVLHAGEEEPELEPELLKGVRGVERLINRENKSVQDEAR